MVTYHYHRMDVINFDCSLTAFRKPSLAEKVKAYFLHLKPETTRGKFRTKKQIFRLVLPACKKLFNHLYFYCNLLAIYSTRILNY